MVTRPNVQLETTTNPNHAIDRSTGKVLCPLIDSEARRRAVLQVLPQVGAIYRRPRYDATRDEFARNKAPVGLADIIEHSLEGFSFNEGSNYLAYVVRMLENLRLDVERTRTEGASPRQRLEKLSKSILTHQLERHEALEAIRAAQLELVPSSPLPPIDDGPQSKSICALRAAVHDAIWAMTEEEAATTLRGAPGRVKSAELTSTQRRLVYGRRARRTVNEVGVAELPAEALYEDSADDDERLAALQGGLDTLTPHERKVLLTDTGSHLGDADAVYPQRKLEDDARVTAFEAGLADLASRGGQAARLDQPLITRLGAIFCRTLELRRANRFEKERAASRKRLLEKMAAAA